MELFLFGLIIGSVITLVEWHLFTLVFRKNKPKRITEFEMVEDGEFTMWCNCGGEFKDKGHYVECEKCNLYHVYGDDLYSLQTKLKNR